MLRPEQMSKVSVTGSKAVMDDVIEAAHDLHLLHLSDYDGSWEGFENGDPIEGAEEASEKLVTVRSLESILDVDEDDAGPSRIVTDEAIESELEEVRQEANELDDRLDEIDDDLRSVEEEIDSIEPFADLGIDLDLLSGYDTLQVAVGEGDEDEIAAALAASDEVDEYETFSGDRTVAAFVYPTADAGEDALEDALVGVDFARIEVPDAEGSPEEYVEELRHERQQLESRRDSVEGDLEKLRLDAAGFLLAAEEKLTIDVQKREAPLQFATTENSFIAEGWVPTERFPDLEAALEQAVGDRVEVDELERADYHEGHPTHSEEVSESGGAAPGDGAEAVTDGGTAVTVDDEPPVIQSNEGAVKPFEFLLTMINRPKYTELDPTFVLFLTFPAFFGYMIGDLGYGLLYLGAGYLLYSRFEEDVFRSLGAIGMWIGGFTALFGILYGEIFGLHVLGEVLFGGSPPMHKGLQPHYSAYGQTWLIVSVLLGLLHLTVGYAFGFVNDLDHGFVDAYLENGSWATLMVGVWIWIFSRHASGPKPDFLFEVLGGDHAAYDLGFTGLPAEIGLYVGLPLAAIGFLTMVYGEIQHFGVAIGTLVGFLESFSVLGDVLSYLRIAAVILAKAGMAFVVNLLFFGVYVTGEEGDQSWHFATGHMPEEGAMYHGHEVTEIMFGGLLHGGVASVLAGVLIFVVGHIIVLLLGITSAGLQGVRLEYVEFFDKFYEGGGRVFEPFGYDREHTAED
ncbi:V-type ATP synthase subunit I [Halostella sp. JP-L12]|uniref:V-type ATP synthase subunit I n=1 Tax=Halostella TaxID=1843185 RepID=UPI000EF8208B|nr:MULTISPECIES: V-type ATP synthase subunit I [Halostella]NHN46713.1 V-type ATP synthase subunit I [Halostella sp. JP-L12]